MAVTTAVTTLVLTPDFFNTMAMACQGLPDRPCPWLQCDATVHNTIYDLFLCKKCEKTRDDATTSAATKITVVDVNSAAILPAGQRKQKRQKDDPTPAAPIISRKKSTRSATKDNSVAANVQLLSTASSLSADPTQAEVNINSVEITDLKAEVHRLTDLVNSLSTKLSFVLSYLQLSDDSILESAVTCAAEGTVPPTTLNAQQAGNMTEPLFSTMVKTGRKPTNFREAAVSAVYADLRQKDSRKNSIILSGLPSRQCDDKSSVAKLFKDEFDLVTDISVCKRLGQQVSGKIQPLLVVLSNPDHTRRILSEAKNLRHSVDMLVRNQVFINPHLTKAEAMAAYEQRCQRRLRNKRPAHEPAGESTGNLVDSSYSLADATTSLVTTSQHVSSGLADYSLSTGHLDQPKVHKQSSN